MKDLKARAKELAHQAADYSRQAVQVSPKDREQGRTLMRQARDASRRCQVLIQEILRQQS
ncbi:MULTISPECIES: hypothetical protein [unclassified Nostoc]|jgi:hypothetical protein|uniref:hypothetical protein n=1 Tax=unclassified Nostoc TaxID=2593658 RepID=UPI001E3EE23D|nr:hypothetical protein [Nostoc sp. CHAB 5715]MCC5610422.1 hypothetical protein [Nostoc sp. CHAB 5834]MCC5622845.1 hypothetical protein [Nostoc sp. CHAB 5715]